MDISEAEIMLFVTGILFVSLMCYIIFNYIKYLKIKKQTDPFFKLDRVLISVKNSNQNIFFESPHYSITIAIGVLCVFVFTSIHAIWTNFLPKDNYILYSKIVSVFLTAPYIYALFAIKITQNINALAKYVLFVIMIVVSYAVIFLTITYSIPSMYTELSSNRSKNMFVVNSKFESKLPLLSDPDCPSRIYVSSALQKNKYKICVSYNELSKYNVGDELIVSGNESFFGLKVKEILVNPKRR
jgi:hypothetical protein